jgi:hypothetical protein
MRFLWSVPVLVGCVFGCGSDETIMPPPRSRNPASSTAPAPHTVDLCGALGALLRTPGTPEHICALQTANRDNSAACHACAANIAFVEALIPEAACDVPVDECPVGNDELQSCFATLGGILSQSVADCDGRGAPVNTTEIGLRLLTSSCALVLDACPAARALTAVLIGGAL